MGRRCNPEGVALIKRWESLRLQAYLCPAGVPTIGYGHTRDVQMGQLVSKHQAEAILDADLAELEPEVDKLAPGSNDNEFSAFVSFAFNLGLANFARSGLLRHHNHGAKQRAQAEFLKWVHARVDGRLVVLPGLVRRREAERLLYLKPSPRSTTEATA